MKNPSIRVSTQFYPPQTDPQKNPTIFPHIFLDVNISSSPIPVSGHAWFLMKASSLLTGDGHSGEGREGGG